MENKKHLNPDTFYICGIQIVSGDFNGKKYHNVNIKCQTPFSEKADSIGINVEPVKIPVDKALQLFNIDCELSAVTSSLFGFLLGAVVDFNYNKFGQIVGINILEKGGVK